MSRKFDYPLELGEIALAVSEEPDATYVVTNFGRKIKVTKEGAKVIMGPPFPRDLSGASQPTRPVPDVRIGAPVHVISSEWEARREPRYRCIEAVVTDVGDRGLIRVIAPQLGGGRTVQFSSRGFVAAKYGASAHDPRPQYTWHTVCLGAAFQEVEPDHVRPGSDL